MKKDYFIFIISACFVCASVLPLHSVAKPSNPVSDEKVSTWLNNISPGFIENKGEVVGLDRKPVNEVLFKTFIKTADIYITTSGITYILKKQSGKGTSYNPSEPEEDEKRPVQWCRMDMQLLNANINKENIIAEEPEQDGYLNYYLPSCPKGIMSVNTYNKITIKNIYPGIDWVLYNNSEGLKYNFIVHPGANPNDIVWKYPGADHINVESSNNTLVLKTSLGEIKEGALNCYQSSTSNSITSSYKVVNNILSFNLGNYNKQQDLVIDPPVDILDWATYYGGEVSTHIGPRAICSDTAGNIYVTGYTDASLMPVQNPGGGAYYNGTFAGGSYMAFIFKFNSAGVRQWATYFGGSNYEWGMGLATDISGNLFLAGFTGSGDLPTLNPGGGAYFQGTLAGGGDFDLFLCKFNSAGALKWSTYYGGTLDDRPRGVDVDASGNFWVTGYTTSSDFPTLNPGAGAFYQGVFGGGVNKGDAFILKFDNNGKQLWATYYGGANDDQGYAIKAAKSGDIFLTGYTGSANMPKLNPGGGAYYQAANAGGNDLFIAKFSNAGIQRWGTYYGGSANDDSVDDTHAIGGLAIDNRENVYITGTTQSTNFPLLNPGGTTYYQAANAGGMDAFILKFRPSGVRVWATYYGGLSDDGGNTVNTDTNGTIYVTGQSVSALLPTLNPGGGAYYQGGNAGGMDFFINEFDSTGTPFWGTFFGGNNDDWSTQGTILPAGCLVLTGEWTSSSGVATVNPGSGAFFQGALTGTHDGCIMKFCPLCTVPNVKINPASASNCVGDSSTLTASGASSYTWKPATGLSCTNCPNPTAKPAATTTYTVVGTNAGVCKDSTTITITVDPGPTITISSDTAIILGASATLKASGGGTYSWVPPFGLSCTNCPSPLATPTVTTAYCVTVTDSNGCYTTKCVTVTVDTLVIPCGRIFVPNAFSPNGDGNNDVLLVMGNCIKTFDFVIYDRWGNKVFESLDPSKGWDGTFNNQPMNTGTYVYYLKASTTSNQSVTQKGSITLVR